LTAFEMPAFLASVCEPREPIRTSEDVVVSSVGRDLYDKLFRNYTRKQWGIDASELDKSVTARVPVRHNRDPRYFTDRFQAMPLHGYTRLFERLLSHPNISVVLGTDWRALDGVVPYRQLVYTGRVDDFFDRSLGELPYRSLEFEFVTEDVEWHQPTAVINYPNDYAYTRVTEFKYLTGQSHRRTTIVREYPTAEGDPYYPVPRPENAERYARYKALAEATPGVHFVGRLATYKYYNMDQVVAQALATYKRLRSELSPFSRPLSSVSSVSQSTWLMNPYHVNPTIGRRSRRRRVTSAHCRASQSSGSAWALFVSAAMNGSCRRSW